MSRRPRVGNPEKKGDCAVEKDNQHIGLSLDDFLRGEGALEETCAIALKETIAWQVQQAKQKDKITKVEMAKRINTSCATLDRLLDPGNPSVTLQTLSRAARAIDRPLRLELVERRWRFRARLSYSRIFPIR